MKNMRTRESLLRLPQTVSVYLLLSSFLSVIPGLNANFIASGNPVLKIDTAKVAAHVSPTLYGLMTEEINYSYDGRLYAELIRNRIFKNDARNPAHWSTVPDKEGAASISLDQTNPVAHTALTP